ncbi:hypothetical protein AB0F71_39435 [Kitasatospora sp. NPDC028055]|uniref:hypothetical protein n=1 Tax=Kitasatospora sp. NPDC028055 TaxID=3155653 RepID=UPI0033F325ED
MSTHRRPLHVRSDDDDQGVEHTAGARRLPVEATAAVEDQAAVDVHQEHVEPPRRRPLGPGPASGNCDSFH